MFVSAGGLGGGGDRDWTIYIYIYIYSRRAAAGSARTKVTRCHMFLLFFFLLLLLLLQVKYFKSKTSKNTVFSDMFMPLELYIDEKNTGIYDVCAASRAKIVQKHCYLHCF